MYREWKRDSEKMRKRGKNTSASGARALFEKCVSFVAQHQRFNESPKYSFAQLQYRIFRRTVGSVLLPPPRQRARAVYNVGRARGRATCQKNVLLALISGAFAANMSGSKFQTFARFGFQREASARAFLRSLRSRDVETRELV